MRVTQAIAAAIKKEGTELLLAYPVNPIIEACAEVDIKPIIVRQERTGIHMADAYSRLHSGRKVGVFACQNGPGTENAFGGIAQAYGESVPLVFLPGGMPRGQVGYHPNFNAFLNFQHITKSAEQLNNPATVWEAIRRAFGQARNGRPGPSLLEVPGDVMQEEAPEFNYVPTPVVKSGPNPTDVDEVARVLIEAERPIIYAGQGVHYARAFDELKQLAELLEIPVTTSLEGKSSFPENHPLALGSGGAANPAPVAYHVQDADVVFGIGASFSRTGFGIQWPQTGKTYIHATNDALDIGKDVPASYALLGDAGLTLRALVAAVSDRLGGKPRGRMESVVSRIKTQKEPWLQQWMPKLTSNDTPINPYRVIWDMMHTLDIPNTVITHDAGSPRDQLSPFWEATAPQSYIGWGKTTQLGYGLGLAMGAKLAQPDKLCINVWGDAAIGMTGMDFETAARNSIPIMSILFNNFSMAMELPVMALSTERFRSTDISGNYADFAKALGGYGERITDPNEVIPALKRGVQQTKDGRPVLLEFITQKEIEYSLRRGATNLPPRPAGA
ncbi:MAG TPA: thiamine pyrophosphate-requiring protein [Dehalococcoidia bacterium]|nr:thiamine pyrophosphate-requiring protein [Dehalococcoidia bacterium]